MKFIKLVVIFLFVVGIAQGEAKYTWDGELDPYGLVTWPVEGERTKFISDKEGQVFETIYRIVTNPDQSQEIKKVYLFLVANKVHGRDILFSYGYFKGKVWHAFLVDFKKTHFNQTLPKTV